MCVHTCACFQTGLTDLLVSLYIVYNSRAYNGTRRYACLMFLLCPELNIDVGVKEACSRSCAWGSGRVVLRLYRHPVARDVWMHLCCKGLKDYGVLDFDLRIAGDSHKAGRKTFAELKNNVLRAG